MGTGPVCPALCPSPWHWPGAGGGPPTPHRPGRPAGPFLLGGKGEEPQSSRVCYCGFTGSLSPVLPTLGALTPASSPHGPAASGPPVSHGHAHPEPCPHPQPAVPLPISQSPDRRGSRPARKPEGCLAPSSPPRHPAKAPQPATSLTPRPPGPQQAHPRARLPAHAPQPGPLQPNHLPASAWTCHAGAHSRAPPAWHPYSLAPTALTQRPRHTRLPHPLPSHLLLLHPEARPLWPSARLSSVAASSKQPPGPDPQVNPTGPSSRMAAPTGLWSLHDYRRVFPHLTSARGEPRATRCGRQRDRL